MSNMNFNHNLINSNIIITTQKDTFLTKAIVISPFTFPHGILF